MSQPTPRARLTTRASHRSAARCPGSALAGVGGAKPLSAGTPMTTFLILIIVLAAAGFLAWFFFVRPGIGSSTPPTALPIGTASAEPTPAGGVKLDTDLGAL